MGLYNFQPRFVPAILAGTKTHTIRAPRKHPDKPGNTLHLYTGLRRQGAQLLMRVICTKVEEILFEAHDWIFINRTSLARDEAEQLARRDGFSSYEEMFKFWDGRLPFEGQVIHWRKP